MKEKFKKNKNNLLVLATNVGKQLEIKLPGISTDGLFELGDDGSDE